MYRLGMISKSELKRRQQERARAQFEMMENCDNGNFFSRAISWDVAALQKLGVALKKTHAKRKPLELQYPECRRNHNWSGYSSVLASGSALELVYRQ